MDTVRSPQHSTPPAPGVPWPTQPPFPAALHRGEGGARASKRPLARSPGPGQTDLENRTDGFHRLLGAPPEHPKLLIP